MPGEPECDFRLTESRICSTDAREPVKQRLGFEQMKFRNLFNLFNPLTGNGVVRDEDGTEKWYCAGELHRDNGPALECTNGTKQWWRHGKRHRDDGPRS